MACISKYARSQSLSLVIISDTKNISTLLQEFCVKISTILCMTLTISNLMIHFEKAIKALTQYVKY